MRIGLTEGFTDDELILISFLFPQRIHFLELQLQMVFESSVEAQRGQGWFWTRASR